LLEPKAIAQTALLDSDELYIKAPLAVNEADEKLISGEKSHIAVVLDATGVTLVNVAPPDVYADPVVFVISSDVLKAVVDAPNVASLSYRAILKVSPVVAVKS
tara:strand:- start:287 stop:595 length:309 start_codon:yes stop_codon:yes gene_type:complete